MIVLDSRRDRKKTDRVHSGKFDKDDYSNQKSNPDEGFGYFNEYKVKYSLIKAIAKRAKHL
jgi:hypothetical protein